MKKWALIIAICLLVFGVIGLVYSYSNRIKGPWPTIAPSINITPAVTTKPTETNRESGDCKIGGCSGQICSDKEVITTCEYRIEYGCYHSAICERGKDDKCGWRQTGELINCIKNAGSNGIKAPVY